MNTTINEGNVKKLLLIGLIIAATCGITFPLESSQYFLGGIFHSGASIFSLFQTGRESNRDNEKATERHFKVSMGKTLKMDLAVGGTIKINGWDKDELAAKVYREGRDDENCKVDFVENQEGIEIRAEYTGPEKNTISTDMTYEINVPRKFNINLETMGGGIEIKNVEGSMEGETKGGMLSLNNLKGRLHLRTMGGDVKLSDSEVDGSVSTMGGNVDIDNVKGDVKGSSMGGNVSYSNVTGQNGGKMSDEVNISSMGGDINVDKAPEGANVSTMGGEIKIGSARKFVKAKTMGGDINVDEADGSVNATTMSGDISVKILGDAGSVDHDVKLTSMSGDVTLYVPADFSMDIDVIVALPKGKSDDTKKIISDFDLNIQEKGQDEEQWHNRNGIQGKHLEAKGSFNGGKNRVEIKTMNGKVYLKKI